MRDDQLVWIPIIGIYYAVEDVNSFVVFYQPWLVYQTFCVCLGIILLFI